MTLLFYSIPVIMNVVLGLFYFMLHFVTNELGLFYTWISFFELFRSILNMIIIPIYFIWVSNKSACYGSIYVKLLLYICSYMIILLILFMSYLSWGIATGNTFSPDSVTILLCKYETIIATVIFVLGCVITRIFKSIMLKHPRK